MEAKLEYNLKHLNLKSFLSNYLNEAEKALKDKKSYIEYLGALAEEEINRRFNQAVQNRLKEAKFPVKKTLDTFDFSFIKSVKKEVIYQLCDGYFTESAKNIILFGPCGTGKTHLAIAIGRELCLKKYQVYFCNVNNFMNLLLRANEILELNKFYIRMQKYDLIILDELGYVPFDEKSTNLLFQFLAEQYERKSLLLTTNLAFSQWEQIFKDKQTTVAAVDRLVHHGYIIQFNGDSYRLKASLKNDKNIKIKKETIENK